MKRSYFGTLGIVMGVFIIGCSGGNGPAKGDLLTPDAQTGHDDDQWSPTDNGPSKDIILTDHGTQRDGEVKDINLPDQTIDSGQEIPGDSGWEIPGDSGWEIQNEDVNIATDTNDTNEVTDQYQPPVIARLKLWPLDIWARKLQDFTLKVTASDGSEVPVATSDIPIELNLTSAGKYTVTVSAKYYDTEVVDVWVDATDQESAVYAKREPGMEYQGLSVSHVEDDQGDGPRWVHSIWFGLRSDYFAASGRPPRRGNKVQLLMDGEEAWSKVKERLDAAQKDIMLSTWWWQSDFELYRPKGTHVHMSQDERRKNTIFYVMTHSKAYKRVLVGEFWSQDGFLDWLNTDKDIKSVAEDPNDDFEFMGQANPSEGKFDVAIPGVNFQDRIKNTFQDAANEDFDSETEVPAKIPVHHTDMTDFPTGATLSIASYHQKFIAIDGKEAFVGGMNVKSTDWDTHKHLVFEPRRMEFDSSESDREDVEQKKSEPDLGPRKDYMVFLQGPIARDVEDLFHKRWHYLLGQGVEYAENSTDFQVPQPSAPVGNVEVQLTVTLPKPLNENSIWESQVNAVRHAQHFIYIEDQYFRAPLLFNAIVDRMLEKPDIKLIVVTKPVNEWTDPGCRWTYESNLLFKNNVGDRYIAVQLRSFDTHVTLGFDETDAVFKDMDVHSKMLIVDDVYMNVGSCNKNNRGLLYEGEANVSILDKAFVSAAIKRIFSNLLDQNVDTTDPDQLFALVKQEATQNQLVWDRWDQEGFDLDLGDGSEPLPDQYKPVGFVYPLPFNPIKECLIENIGPDVMMPYKGD